MARLKTLISADVCGADAFVDMSFEAQAAWPQINLAADGMGACDCMRKVLRQSGISADALQELVDAGFVLETDYHGQPVYFITHFWVANKTQGKRTYFGKYLNHAIGHLTFESKEYRAYTQLGAQATSNLEAILKVNEINQLKENERNGSGGDSPVGEAVCPKCGKPAQVFIDGDSHYLECRHCRQMFEV